MRFHTVTDEEIRQGRVTDIYFPRTREILERRGENPRVRAEFVAKSLPDGWEWAVLAGVEEAAGLLSHLGVSARGMPEGSLFRELEPVLEVEGPYLDFCIHETAMLGFLCQVTGVATRAARCRRAAGERLLLSFGARRLHPSVAAAVERAAYVGGCDGVATVAGAELIGIEPSGTMPHALVLVIGDTVEATRAFHETMDPSVPRVSLIDTFQDEKFEALRVAEALGEALDSVRLDTPGTRRGDYYRILEEVRWELDRAGHGHVQLFASGGIDEEQIRRLNPLVRGYGVGGAISAAPIVDFAMDIVEIEGRAVAKRGKWSGAKQVFRCPSCPERSIRPLASGSDDDAACPACGAEMESLLIPLVREGEPVGPFPPAPEVRGRTLEELARLEAGEATVTTDAARGGSG